MAVVDPWTFLRGDSVEAARRLLGCLLVAEVDGQKVTLKIVETEAYHQSDAASHSYKGRTPRTDVMFGPAGHLYVYFTYGMHYCLNVVTGAEGEGSAVLIRAVEPLDGLSTLRDRRPKASADTDLTNGPAKLCQALGVTKEFNGHDLHLPPLQLQIEPALLDSQIVQTTRIGITRDVHRPWRFYIAKNRFISRP